jgi:hypothetical protein
MQELEIFASVSTLYISFDLSRWCSNVKNVRVTTENDNPCRACLMWKIEDHMQRIDATYCSTHWMQSWIINHRLRRQITADWQCLQAVVVKLRKYRLRTSLKSLLNLLTPWGETVMFLVEECPAPLAPDYMTVVTVSPGHKHWHIYRRFGCTTDAPDVRIHPSEFF